MTGGTGAVSAGRSGAHLASTAEHSSGVGTAVQSSWPLRTHLPLHALATAPACARGHVRTVAHEWGLSDLADTAELLVSELVTNAIHASQRSTKAGIPVVQLWMTSEQRTIVIYVWDASDEMPVRRDAMPDDESGRGLMLVATLGKDWGAYKRDRGKVVWVMLAADP